MICAGFDKYEGGEWTFQVTKLCGYFLAASACLWFWVDGKKIIKTDKERVSKTFTRMANQLFLFAFLVNLLSGSNQVISHCILTDVAVCTEGFGVVNFYSLYLFAVFAVNAIYKVSLLRFLCGRMAIVRMPAVHRRLSKRELGCAHCAAATSVIGCCIGIANTFVGPCVPAKDEHSAASMGGTGWLVGLLMLFYGIIATDCINCYMCYQYIIGLAGGIKNAKKLNQNADVFEKLVRKTCRLGFICLSSTMFVLILTILSGVNRETKSYGYVSAAAGILDSVVNCICVYKMRAKKREREAEEENDATQVSDAGDNSAGSSSGGSDSGMADYTSD